MMNNDNIDNDIIDICSIDKNHEQLQELYIHNMIEAHIPGMYRNEENDKFFKLWLHHNIALFGFSYLLNYKAQTGKMLDILAEMLFKVKRQYGSIILNDTQFVQLLSIAETVRCINADSYYDFYQTLHRALGDNITIQVDVKSKILTYYISNIDTVTMSVVLDLQLLPIITGLSARVILLTQKPLIKFRDYNVDADIQYDHINFEGLNNYDEPYPSFLIDYNNVFYIK